MTALRKFHDAVIPGDDRRDFGFGIGMTVTGPRTMRA
jgi:hypothetical protein